MPRSRIVAFVALRRFAYFRLKRFGFMNSLSRVSLQAHRSCVAACMFGMLLSPFAIPESEGRMSLALPSGRQSTAPDRADPPTKLVVGSPIEREIQAGSTQDFVIYAKASQFFHADVEQRGIDILIGVLDPQGNQITEADSPTGADGVETVSFVASATGNHTLRVVYGDGSEPPSGKYVIRAPILRDATEKDRARFAAELAQNEALPHFIEETSESLVVAISKYQTAVTHWRHAGEPGWEADTLSNIGASQVRLAQYGAAIATFREELALRRSLRDTGGEALVLDNLGVVHGRLGNSRDALTYHEQALSKAQASGDADRELNARSHIASLRARLGNKKQAMADFDALLPMVEASGDKAILTATLGEAATVAAELGNRQKALELFSRLLPLARSEHQPSLESTALLEIGKVLLARGSGDQAIAHYRQALAVSEAAGFTIGVARSSNAIGSAYNVLGDAPEAMAWYVKALAIFSKERDVRGQAGALNNIGLSWAAMGRGLRSDEVKALRYFSLALGKYREAGETYDQAIALTNVGRAHVRLKQPSRAIPVLKQALALSRSRGNRAGEAASHKLLGDVYRDTRQWALSMAAYEAALPLATDSWFFGSEATVLLGMAKTERARGRLADAQMRIEQAIDVLESVRGSVSSKDLRTSYFAAAHLYYDFYVDLLMQRHSTSPKAGWNAKALEASERARARSLIELIAESGADIRTGAPPEITERVAALRESLAAKAQAQLGAAAAGLDAEREALVRETRDLVAQLNAALAEARAASPKYANLTAPPRLTLSEIQDSVLDAGTTLVEYWLGEERSYVWVVCREGLTSVELPARRIIEAEARRLHEAVKLPPGLPSRLSPGLPRAVSARRAESVMGTALARMVLAPVARDFGTERILIVADGALQFVPFAALPVNGTPLVVSNEVVSAPSASTIAAVRRETDGRATAARSIVMLADPVFEDTDTRIRGTAERSPVAEPTDSKRGLGLAAGVPSFASGYGAPVFRMRRLPSTRDESASIKALAPDGSYFLDFAASRPQAMSEDLASFRIVHYATHGALNASNPEISGLVFSLVDELGNPRPGYLPVTDIFNMRLGADLVVLSACETGLGPNVRGEGLVGMTRAFMYAGAPTVVVSLWSVSDPATASLMAEFYSGLLKNGKSPAAALRAAQLKMWSRDTWRAPFYWAPFVVQGDWKDRAPASRGPL